MTEHNENQNAGSFFETIRAVLWSFIGVRSPDGYKSDISRLSMTKLIIIGIVGAILFVLTLVLAVNFVMR